MDIEDKKDFQLADLVEPLKCSACGKELPRGTVFCPYCGYEIKQNNKEVKQYVEINKCNENDEQITNGLVKPINKWISFTLCLFFGYFGAHKFYEGNKKMGFIYLFTIGLFGFGWFIDMFVILFKPNPYYVKTV